MGAWIERVWTENTGGGCMVDFVQLKDGHVIAISDEAACIYKNYQGWLDDIDGESVPSILNYFSKLEG